MMKEKNPKFEQLARAVGYYAELKGEFGKFCETGANKSLPGVSFSADSDGTAATILAFDQTFRVRFHAVPSNGALIGVLGVYLPAPGDKEILLWHTFFGNHGDVKDTPDAPYPSFNLWSDEFLNKMLGEFSDLYFSHLTKTLGLTPDKRA